MSWLPVLAVAPVLAAGTVTFNRDIAPLIFRNCSSCHRQGEAAPFPLLTYEHARNHALQIVAVTARRYMPPWQPAPGYGDFLGERRLTADQLRLIAEWVKQGCPEGQPADLPPQPRFTPGWQMGPPDLIIEVPQPYRLPAAGGNVFRNFVLPVNLRETRYVRAIELRPGAKQVVHHANVWIDRRRSLRQRDGEGGQPGFPGMEPASEARSESFDPDSHFLFWKPGTVVEPEPPDMNWRLDPGTDLILNVHLQPSGKEELIQPAVGLYFSPHPPTRFPMLLQLEHDGALDIPPGAADFAVADHLTLPVDVEMLAIYPHAHYLGKRVEAWATLPDGTRRWLIRIDDWDFNWQAVYTYRRPVPLPQGATIAMRIAYDNSASNPRNPNQPPKRVRTGPRSEDEMGHVWLQVLPRKKSTEDPRLTLQEASMRRRLEKYPGDFLAHYNLGALVMTRGEHREAVLFFRRAVSLRPSSASARNGLAGALMAEGRNEDAIPQLREALRIDPVHANARLNLAKALMRKGDLDGAAAELDIFLMQRPDNAGAQLALGTVCFVQRRYEQAVLHLQQAARLQPEDAEIRAWLARAQAALDGKP